MKFLFRLALLAGLISTAAQAQTITAPTGTVTTSDGASWSWGGTAPQIGQYYVLRNGVSADGGEAAVMEVSGGLLYAENTSVPPGVWFLWNGSGWTPEASAPSTSAGGTTTNPTPSPTPTPVVGSIPTQLTESGPVTMPSPTGGYVANSTTALTATLPNPATVTPCGLPGTYFENDGSAQLILQVPAGEVWLGEVPNSQNVYLGYQSNSGHAWCDGTSWHFGN